MKLEDFEVLERFTTRVRPVLTGKVDRFPLFKVGKEEYKALYRYQLKYEHPFFDFDYKNLLVVDEAELASSMEEYEQESDYVSKIVDSILDISTKRDIERWPKDFRPAIKISELEMGYLKRCNYLNEIIPGRMIFGMDLYVDDSEVDMVNVPVTLQGQLKCSAIGPIPRRKQLN